jgi:hypothetical protein
MVVEPPGDFGRVRVLEIDDGVFVAIEQAGSPRLRSPVGHAGEAELRRGIEFFLVKAVEKSGGGGAIKTAVVETQPDAGHVVAMAPFVFSCLAKAGTKPFRVEGREKEVKWKARMRNTKKTSRLEERTARNAQKFGGSYCPTIFSTMFPMIGSLNFSWL